VLEYLQSVINFYKERYVSTQIRDSMTRLYIFLANLAIFVLIGSSYLTTVVSSFVNQQYIDQVDDWSLIGTPTGNFSILSPNGEVSRFIAEDDRARCNIHMPDIRGVSYHSDGKTINATLWVSPLLINQSTSYSQVKK
jgi:hypothetical protein